MDNSNEIVVVKKIRKHGILRHPFLGCFLLTLWGFLFYQLGGVFLAKSLGMDDAMASLFCAAFGLLLLPIHHFWFRGEFKGFLSSDAMKDRRMWQIIGVWALCEGALIGYSYISAGVDFPTLAVFAEALMAGVSEEAIFRGLDLSIMMRRYKDNGSLVPVFLFPAAIFGVIHFANMVTGASFSATLGQVIFATGIGCFFAAIYLRSGNLAITMGMHFLYDLLVMMTHGRGTSTITEDLGMSYVLIQAVIAAVEIALACWMMKGQKEKIHARWKTIWRTPVLASAMAEESSEAE